MEEHLKSALMTSKEMFTDEEILSELKKLGYNSISPELFHILKEDLYKMVVQGEHGINNFSVNSEDSSFFTDSSLGSKSSLAAVTDEPHSSAFSLGYTSESQTDSGAVSSGSQQDATSDKENALTSSQLPAGEKMIKRKVLRHRNGQSFITEELRPFPDSGCSSEKSKASSEKLSWQRLSSAASSSSTERNGRQSRQSSVILPNMNVKAKKCDPVTKYHQYRKYWETFKPPGERKHKHLRWTIRERMLEYDFA